MKRILTPMEAYTLNNKCKSKYMLYDIYDIYMTVITNSQSSFKSTYWKELHLYFTCASDRVEGFQGNPLQCSIVVGSELLYPSDANSYRYPDIAHLYIPTAAAMLFLYHRDPRHRKSPSVCVYVCVFVSPCVTSSVFPVFFFLLSMF